MKFAIPYKRNSFIEPDEYNIEFTKNSDYDNLIDFISSNSNIQINVHFQENMDIEKIKLINKLFNNFAIKLDPKDIQYLPQLQDNNVKFIFNNTMPINNYGLLDWAILMKPIGIYIADDLFYNLINVETQCRKANIEIRMILNRMPLTNPLLYDNFKAPIYRPQDFDLLNNYISVGEFDCSTEYEDYSMSKCKTLYEIWFENKYWDDDLRFINKDISSEIISSCVPIELATYRSSCGFACRSHGISSCRKCSRLINLAEKNKQNGLAYKKDVKQCIPTTEELINLMKERETNDD